MYLYGTLIADSLLLYLYKAGIFKICPVDFQICCIADSLWTFLLPKDFFFENFKYKEIIYVLNNQTYINKKDCKVESNTPIKNLYTH